MLKQFFIIILFAIAALGAITYTAYQRILELANQPILVTEDTLFTLKTGTGRQQLETLLVDQNIIHEESAKWFQWLLRLEPELAKTKAATYKIPPNITVRELMQLFASGKEAQFNLQFIEGTKLSDALQTLAKAPYIEHTIKDMSYENISKLLGLDENLHPEGWIFPDTYSYTAYTKDIDLLKRAHKRLQKELDAAWKSRANDLPYSSPTELLIMASIIEKETAIAGERNDVASVFVNRINKNMRLQTDPTVIYGMGEKYKGNITKQDLATPTVYNTYTIDGLPPSAISLVGLASLQAAANPSKTNYLYFVADGKGGHSFNTNLKSHNSSVRSYVNTLKERRKETTELEKEKEKEKN